MQPMPSPPTPAWNEELLRNPHAQADKRARVQKMFAAIAPSYDLNNRLHSFGQDQRWRRKAVKMADLKGDDLVVDVACGTGDLSMAFAGVLGRLRASVPWTGRLNGGVVGVDFTYEMLPIANRKSQTSNLKSQNPKPQTPNPSFINGDAQSLPLPDDCCDVVSIAFGIRNVQQPAVAIGEFYRILRPGGRLIILEFSEPTNPLIRFFNNLYTAKIMPRTATWLSGDTTGAYKYLPQSVKTFATREQMIALIQAGGFITPTQHPLTFGVCVCYRAVKPS